MTDLAKSIIGNFLIENTEVQKEVVQEKTVEKNNKITVKSGISDYTAEQIKEAADSVYFDTPLGYAIRLTDGMFDFIMNNPLVDDSVKSIFSAMYDSAIFHFKLLGKGLSDETGNENEKEIADNERIKREVDNMQKVYMSLFNVCFGLIENNVHEDDKESIKTMVTNFLKDSLESIFKDGSVCEEIHKDSKDFVLMLMKKGAES